MFANPSDKWRHEDYVVSAAGVAAELLVYQNKNSDGAAADRADFASPDAPLFDETVNEARLILSEEMVMLEKIRGCSS